MRVSRSTYRIGILKAAISGVAKKVFFSKHQLNNTSLLSWSWLRVHGHLRNYRFWKAAALPSQIIRFWDHRIEIFMYACFQLKLRCHPKLLKKFKRYNSKTIAPSSLLLYFFLFGTSLLRSIGISVFSPARRVTFLFSKRSCSKTAVPRSKIL